MRPSEHTCGPAAQVMATYALWLVPTTAAFRRRALFGLHQAVKFTQVAALSNLLMLVAFRADVVLDGIDASASVRGELAIGLGQGGKRVMVSHLSRGS